MVTNMHSSVDTLAVTVQVIISQALTAITTLEKRFLKLGQITQRISGLISIKKQLHAVGLEVTSTGRIVDAVTRETVRNAQIVERLLAGPQKFSMQKEGINQMLAPAEKVGGAQRLLDQVTADIKKQGLAGQQTIDRLNKSAEQAKSKIGGMNQAMLGFGLSILFTGMAIKRLGDNILKSLVKTYMTATDEQSKFNQALLGVQASFEFLKFSIMDALGNSELVLGLVEALISAVNWISAFVNKHPLVAMMIGLFAVLAIVVGGLAMVIGQTALGFIGILAAASLLSVGLSPFMATVVVVILGVVATILLLGAAFFAIKGIIGSSMSPMKKFFALLGVFLLAGVVLVLLLGATLALPIIAIFAIVTALYFLSQRLGGVKNAFKALGIFVLAILAFVGDAILETLLIPIRLVIVAINTLIKGWNKLADTGIGKKAGLKTIGEIDQPEFARLSKGVWEMRNKLIADAEEERQRKEDEKNLKAQQDSAAAARSGNPVTVNVFGDVTDANLTDRIQKQIEEQQNSIRERFTGVSLE